MRKITEPVLIRATSPVDDLGCSFKDELQTLLVTNITTVGICYGRAQESK